MLETHNSLRAIHGSPPLSLDNKLNSIALKYAEHLADTNTFKHSYADDLGENLYMSYGTELVGSIPVQAWYDEKKDYPSSYGESASDNATGVVGHFT